MDDENDENPNCDDVKSTDIISADHLQPKPLCPPLSGCEEPINGGDNSLGGSPQGGAGIGGPVHKPLIIIIIMRSLRKNLEAVPGKHSIDSLQKTPILGTSHIIRKVLQCEA